MNNNHFPTFLTSYRLSEQIGYKAHAGQGAIPGPTAGHRDRLKHGLFAVVARFSPLGVCRNGSLACLAAIFDVILIETYPPSGAAVLFGEPRGDHAPRLCIVKPFESARGLRLRSRASLLDSTEPPSVARSNPNTKTVRQAAATR